MRRWTVAGFLLVIAAALVWRCGNLSERPLHNDEAINAFKLRELWREGRYQYDPHEYHGPLLYYAAWPVLALDSFREADQPTEGSMRVVTVVFGVGLILLGLLVRREVGSAAVLASGFFTAISPAMVYYSRYFIHEIPLVFFSFLALASGWRYSICRTRGWAVLGGVSIGLMYATKETFVFSLAAGAVGLVAAVFLGVADDRGATSTVSNAAGGGVGGEADPSGPSSVAWLREGVRRVIRGVPPRDLVWASLAFGAVSVVLYSSFFTNPRGPLDGIRTYLTWFGRAEGATPHVHPWYFYLQRLGWFHARGGPRWTETMVLALALVGMVAAWRGKVADRHGVGWFRFLSGYTVALAALYSLIPYKTPWCFLGFYHGCLWLAGFGAWGLYSRFQGWVGRGAVAVLVALGSAHLAWQAWQASHEYAADYRNPYVYGHTSADISNLLEAVEAVAAVSADGKRTAMQVMAPDSAYWPLPWYWREWEQAGWWDRVPDGPTAPLVVVAAKLQAGLEEKTGGAWVQAGMFELRPRYFVEFYVEAGLWKRFLATRTSKP